MNVRKLLVCFCLLSGVASANEYGVMKQMTESREFDNLREAYRNCVVKRGELYVKVASIDSAIAHAPISCKRELFGIRQFLLSGAFKVEVIDQLMQSVEEGVEIDLVNTVYDYELKRRGIKQ